ncbi:crossover junction endodeoxyribonuclease RuvC, partial [Stenotrophomonas maltophilia]|uniref:crossover junction endodeoxyribonuclease RuvC n=1 Tax=Stenotrophomonas maltophilia TaxID=40324 RepID=UPI0022B77BAA|nr:crossover junction endodeoxyribonuclease RuvC [Stenotrophomonas maltophilia]
MTRILGIDPGSQRTGVGIIDVDAAGRVTYVHHQPLVLLGADDFPQRMKLLVLGLAQLQRRIGITGHEHLFNGHFLRLVLAAQVGQARGAAISA